MNDPKCRLAALATACFAWTAAAAPPAVWHEPLTALRFVEARKGCYPMGVPEGTFVDQDPVFRQRIERTEWPAHEVCVDAFWIGETEVTVAAWNALMGPRTVDNAGQTPVINVTWQEAQAFADRLTQRSNGKSRFRLPTEAEWEFACRAGGPPTMAVVGTDDLNPLAWYSSRYDLPSAALRYTTVQPVATRLPNAWGLYDMLGNAWEWTQDAYADDAYPRHTLFNPLTQGNTSLRVLRGGGFRSDKRWIRCEARSSLDANTRTDAVGFRLVRIPSGEN